MSRWFRFYDCALDDPKVQRLPDRLFKAWVNLLCLASRNAGRLPDLPDVAFALRMSDEDAIDIINDLAAAELIDGDDDGYFPHNWKGRQFSSDNDETAAERKRKQRDREAAERAKRVTSQNVTRDQSQDVTRTEQNRAETEQIDSGATSAPIPISKFENEFSAWWLAYPRREGSNPRKPALRSYVSARRKGATAEEMLGGLAAYSATVAHGSPYVAQAVTWLNQERWKDHQPPPRAGPYIPDGAPSEEELRAKYAVIN